MNNNVKIGKSASIDLSCTPKVTTKINVFIPNLCEYSTCNKNISAYVTDLSFYSNVEFIEHSNTIGAKNKKDIIIKNGN